MAASSLDPPPHEKHVSPIASAASTMPWPDAEIGADADAAENDHGAELSRVQSSPYPKLGPLIILLLGVCLTVFLVALDMTIIATAIPRITDEFRSLQDYGWYGSAFFLTVGAFQSTWGKGYKYFDLKWVFLLSMAIFELGSLICALSHNSTTLIVGRAVAGVGGAGVASGAYTILGFSAPPEKVPALTGVLGATFAVASVAGPLLGGVFTDGPGWRWCFWVNLPIGGMAGAIVGIFFKTPKQAKPIPATRREKIYQMDFVGTVMLIVGLVCIILALQWAGVTKKWSDGSVIATLVVGLTVLISFVGWELWLGERALLVPRLIKQRAIWTQLFFQCFNSGTFFVLLYYLPIYFQVVSGVSAAQSGVRNIPYVVGISLFSIVGGLLITVFGEFQMIMIFGASMTTIGAGLIYTLAQGSPPRDWIGYQIVGGIGTGLSLQIPVIVGQAVSKPEDISSVSAIILFFQTLAGAVFISMSQSIFSNTLLHAVVKNVKGLDPQVIVGTGATDLRKVVQGAQLQGAIDSYMTGLKNAYILSIALGSCATLAAVLTFVIDRRTLKPPKAAKAAPDAAEN